MVENSTLFYLVDDFNLPSDMILNPLNETKLPEEHWSFFLDMLEIDPGHDLVQKTMERMNFI
jgi:hypothetical protein